MSSFMPPPANSWDTTVLLRRDSARSHRTIPAVKPGEITALFLRSASQTNHDTKTTDDADGHDQDIGLLSALRQWQHEWD